MLKLNASARFKKDYKQCIKRGYDLELLQSVVEILRIPDPLPPKNKDHTLSGNWIGSRECHILPEWLLIYRIAGDELYLVRTGTHADLFGS